MGLKPTKVSYDYSDLPPLPSLNPSVQENFLPNPSRQNTLEDIVNDYESAMTQILIGKNKFIRYNFYTLVYGEKRYIFRHDLIDKAFENICISKIKITFTNYESNNKIQKEKRQFVEKFNSIHSPGYKISPNKIEIGSLPLKPIYDSIKEEQIKLSDFARFNYHDTLINEQTKNFIEKQKPPCFETLKDLFELAYGEQKTINLSDDNNLIDSIFEKVSKSQKDFDSYMHQFHTFSKETIIKLLSWIQDISMKLVQSYKSHNISEMYDLRYKFKIICAVIISSKMLKKFRNIFISEMENIKILFRIILKKRIHRLNIESANKRWKSTFKLPNPDEYDLHVKENLDRGIEETPKKWRRFIIEADISIRDVPSGKMTQVLESIYDTSKDLDVIINPGYRDTVLIESASIMTIPHFCGFPESLFEKYYKDTVIKEKRQKGSCLKKSIEDYTFRSSSIFVIRYEKIYQQENKEIKG